jgi:predicted phosphate transport protein (TIGR00153 family)
MFNLLPKDTVFYDLFEGLAQHVVNSAEHLQQLVRQFPDIAGPLQHIREEEHAADQLAHNALDRLDRTFITPFDREDIHTLIGELDDIIDSIDALAKRIPLFHVKRMEEGFVKQAQLLVESTTVLRDAVQRLRKDRKLEKLSKQLIEIHHKESVGDDNHHAAMSRLFDGSTDPLDVVKWKELYDYIEEAIDGCEDVGNTLERIVLKNG